MSIMNKPDEQIFASGAKTGEVVNFPHILRGWGIAFDETQGIPTMEHFNALFKRLDEKDLYLLQQGLPEWSATLDYPANALVKYQGKIYRSLKVGKNQTPNTTGSTFWVEWGIDSKQLTPKKLTATTRNTIDSTGHSHEIDKASISQPGIVQLDSATNSTAENKAATPKAVKTVKDQVDSLQSAQANYIPNSKKSDATNSSSNDTVATSAAVKQLNDKITQLNFYKVNVKGGSNVVTFDLTNRAHWIAEIGSVYKGSGHYQLTFHNAASHQITNLPLSNKTPVQLDLSLMGAFSLVRCHYFYENRTFTARVDWNKETFPLTWFEDVKLNNQDKVPRDTTFSANVVVGEGDNTTTARLKVGGDLSVKGSTVVINSAWTKQKFPITNGGEWRFECNPNSEADPRFNFVYKMKNDTQRYCTFPKLEKTEIVAYRSWVETYAAANYFKRGALTTENLDEVQTYGVYMQAANANATPERNYPLRFAGTLEVLPSAYSVMQKYTSFYTGEEYQRNRNIDNRSWSAWRRVDGIAKVSKTGDTLTGGLVVEHATGSGAFSNQWNAHAPYFTDVGNANGGNTYYPYVKGRVRNGEGWGTAFSFGYVTPGRRNSWGKGVIHLMQDNGGEKHWFFNHDGNFNSSGDVITGNGVSLNALPASVNARVSKTGDTLTGGLVVEHATGSGAFSNQWNAHAPYFTDVGNANGGNTYYPYVKGRVRNGEGWGTAFSFGYVTPGEINKFGKGVIHLIEDNGWDKNWFFNHDGSFKSSGDVVTGNNVSLNGLNDAVHNVYQKIGNFEIRRYPDGTMLQTYFVSFSHQHHYQHEHVYSFNWAVSFVEKPMVFGNVRIRDRDFKLSDNFQAEVSGSTGSTYYYCLFDPGGNQGNKDMMFFAIGRWK